MNGGFKLLKAKDQNLLNLSAGPNWYDNKHNFVYVCKNFVLYKQAWSKHGLRSENQLQPETFPMIT